MNNKELPPNDSFFSILRNNNPLEGDFNDFQNLVISGLTTEQAVAKLRMDRKPPIGAENYSYLLSVWENNNNQYNCQEAHPSLTDTDIERGVKKLQQDEMRRDYIQQKGYQNNEM